MTELRPIHLIERAAARLREEAGLASLASQPDAVAVPASEAAAAPRPAATALPLPEAAATPVTPAAPASPAFVDRATLEQAGLVSQAARRSRIAEELRVTAGNLLRAAGQIAGTALQPPANLLLVTSARPNEGKSFLSLNLAATLAEQGVARTLVVDFDAKPRSLSALLGLEGAPGLTDLGADSALRADAIAVRTAIRDLTILPSGRALRGEPGLTRKLAAGLERLSRRYTGQMVVIDAPPCLATSEAAMLAPLVGTVALVVEAEQTQRQDLERALDLLKANSHIVLLLNKVRDTGGSYFGGYDYYGV